MKQALRFLLLPFLCASLFADDVDLHLGSKVHSAFSKPFTGKVIGKKVRMRVSPDLDSQVVRELDKNELVIINGQSGDFFSVQPPKDIKTYIFRSFVLDDIVEGSRVNVRISPDRDAPIVGHLNTGTVINGKICEENSKWIEIPPPETTNFYVAKEFIENIGGTELKAVYDRRRESVTELLDATDLLKHSESRKPFQEVDAERITHNYETIIRDYADFPEQVQQAQKSLIDFQEFYLQKKIAFLESKASIIEKNKIRQSIPKEALDGTQVAEKASFKDRLRIWEPIEKALYLSWSASQHAKTMDDFYEDQKLRSVSIHGRLEPYFDPIKNKPADFVVKEGDLPIAFVYSTHVDLHSMIGKVVDLTVSPRPNNNFAFPAYYVLEVEQSLTREGAESKAGDLY